MSPPRHRWDKLDLHRYRCRQCGLVKIHVMVPDPNPRAMVRWEQRFERAAVVVSTGATPPCPGRPPVSALDWRRDSRYSETAQTGHSVSAAMTLQGWRYTAWGPDQAAGVPHWQWPPEEIAQVTWPRGARVPTPRELLGIYTEAAAARTRCAEDAAAHGARVGA